MMVNPHRLISQLTALYLQLFLLGIHLPNYDAYSLDNSLQSTLELGNPRCCGYFGSARIQAQVV